MPTKRGPIADCSITRPCECGLGLRPRRLFGFLMEPVDGAPCFFSGSLALGRCGLPTTDRLADCFAAGNGKIQGRVCHRWFTRGQRPPGLCDQRYTWAHLFAAVQPETGRSFALVLPELNTNAMQVFLDTFAATLAADEHGVIVMD
jgi:hypothetical protein